MLEINSLAKSFGGVQVLNDISFKVEEGQIVGFLGANGAGKTTTMDILCGCSGADRGEVKIFGHDITAEPLAAKAKLGYLPDIPPLHTEMVVREFIVFAAKLHGLRGDKIATRVAEVLSKLELHSVEHRIIGNLSKGYRQRVALAQALVHDPKVLVLDEPTEGLDPNQIVHIRELIKSLAGQHTIILSSHILSEVEQVCEKIIIIHKGTIVREGTYHNLVEEMESERSYILRVERNAAKLVSELEGVDGIAVPRLESNTISFALRQGAAADTTDKVARKVLDGGFGLRELALKAKTLEDVFFQVTK
ncbi:MAG: ABC transporter ATP-binding protein [Pseudomonadota bacterium]|nr:ABC transporter ATP-binding protein [Pseudomonadota bacterium]